MEQSSLRLSVAEDIVPYNIHVSNRYLDLTKQKLQLTRLPHEILLPPEQRWRFGTPKAEVEPLIDFWYVWKLVRWGGVECFFAMADATRAERYDWRARESELNATLRQFRTVISLPDNQTQLRVHFLHHRSPHPNSIPLLIIPAFPITNLSLPYKDLLRPLTNPGGAEFQQPFHVVVPSLPGLGFSDGFGRLSDSEFSYLEKTAHVLDSLMLRLGYQEYICTATGSGSLSPAGIDYHLPRLIAMNHRHSCRGIHLIDPTSSAPTLWSAPWHWLRYRIARFFKASWLGYTADDWIVQQQSIIASNSSRYGNQIRKLPTPPQTFQEILKSGLSYSNTILLALCDSPVGLLSAILQHLHTIDASHGLSQREIIDITQLVWLPGPEGILRYVCAAAEEGERLRVREDKCTTAVAVSNFNREDDGVGGYDKGKSGTSVFSPLAWVKRCNNIIWRQRIGGLPGFVGLQRPEVIIDGCRGLAEAIIRDHGWSYDDGLAQQEERLASKADIELSRYPKVVEAEEEEEEEEGSESDVESPDTVILGSLL